MNIENSIIFKPNELIEVINRPISSTGLKAYNLILQKLQKANTDRIVLLPKDIDIDGYKNYDELYSYLDELQKIQVKSIDKRGKTWGSFVLISEFKKLDEGIFVAVPPTIYNVLCGKDKKQEQLYYTTIKLLEEKVFKSAYSIILYEIFKKYEKIELPCYSLEELKELTKAKEKYKVYYDFKRYVLNIALKEINKYESNYIYSFKELKFGKKVSKIQFTRELKNQKKEEDLQEIIMSEKLLKAIKKAKKSVYINKVYSDKAMKKLLVKYDESLIIRALEESAKYNQEINSFSSFVTAKVEDIKNSSNEAIERKLEELNKNVTSAPKEKKIMEDNIADIFETKTDENIEELKILLLQQIKNKNKGEVSFILESTIKACRTREDIEMIANDFKIKL